MGTIAYTIVCGIGPRVPRRVPAVSRRERRKVAGIAAGAPAALAGAALRGAARCSRGRLRRAPDGDARARARRADRTSTTGSTRSTAASIYVVERGRARPPIVLSHGVTLSVRTWFHQLEALPEGGLPHDRVRPPRSRPVGARRRGPLAREPRARRADRARGSRPARRGARRPLDGRRRGAGVRHAVPRDRGRARRRHRVALDARARRRSARARRARRRASSRSRTARPTSQLAVGRRRTSGFLAARLGFGKRPASEPRRARAPDDGASARPRPGSTRRAR